MNYGETAAAAETVASSAEEIRKADRQGQGVGGARQGSRKRASKDLKKAAKTPKSKIADGKPATGELNRSPT